MSETDQAYPPPKEKLHQVYRDRARQLMKIPRPYLHPDLDAYVKKYQAEFERNEEGLITIIASWVFYKEQ